MNATVAEWSLILLCFAMACVKAPDGNSLRFVRQSVRR